MQEAQHTQQTATRRAQNQDKKTTLIPIYSTLVNFTNSIGPNDRDQEHSNLVN